MPCTFAAFVNGSFTCRATHRFDEGLPLEYLRSLCGVGNVILDGWTGRQEVDKVPMPIIAEGS